MCELTFVSLVMSCADNVSAWERWCTVQCAVAVLDGCAGRHRRILSGGTG